MKETLDTRWGNVAIDSENYHCIRHLLKDAGLRGIVKTIMHIEMCDDPIDSIPHTEFVAAAIRMEAYLQKEALDEAKGKDKRQTINAMAPWKPLSGEENKILHEAVAAWEAAEAEWEAHEAKSKPQLM